MKDLCLIYQKENKSLIKKLVSKLESDGISCWVSPRDFKQEEEESLKKTIEDAKILVLIIDKNSSANKEIAQALEFALDNNADVIPFVLEKIDSNLYTNHFFYAFSWVAAYEDTFEVAYEVLIDAYQELSGESKSEKKINKSNKNKSKEPVSKPLIYGLIGIAIAIIAYFVYTSLGSNNDSGLLVGKWKISEYHDNLPRNHQDSINIIQSLQNLKASALLTFNEDGTFERRGFTAEPQIGKWEYDVSSGILTMEPNGSTEKNKANIENLSENKFIMVVNEEVDKNKVTTKITFSR